MKGIKIFSLSSLCLVAATAFAAQGTPKQQITAIYAKLDALTVKKDLPGLTKLLKDTSTKDCVFIDGKGKHQTPADVIAGMSSQLAGIDKFNTSTSHIDKMTPKAGGFVLVVTGNLEVSTKAGPDGKIHKLSEVSVSEDTWVKVGAAWKLKMSKQLKDSVKVDGKPIGA